MFNSFFFCLSLADKAYVLIHPMDVFATEDEILLLFFDFRGMNRA
jgi:hypothetical protein